MFYFLSYVSRSTVKNTDEILDSISEVSSRNNSKKGISGVLLLNGNYFFQVLEGPEQEVKKTFEKISLDKRHSEIRILLHCYNEKKLFDQWFMKGFNLQSYFDIDPIEFREKLRQEIGREVNSKADIIALLTNFKKLVVSTDKSK